MKEALFVETLLAIANEIKFAGLRADINKFPDIEKLSTEEIKDTIYAIVRTLTEKELAKIK